MYAASIHQRLGWIARRRPGNHVNVVAEQMQGACEFSHVRSDTPDVRRKVCADQGDLNRGRLSNDRQLLGKLWAMRLALGTLRRRNSGTWYYSAVMLPGADFARATVFAPLLTPHSPLVAPMRKGWLVSGLAGSIVLVATWAWVPTRLGWDALDLWVFGVFNHSLADGPDWQRFWAYANHRGADLLAMTAFGILFVAFAARGRDSSFLHRVLMGGFAVLVTSVVVFVSEKLFKDFGRLSPSLAVEGAIRLRDLVPDVRFKDASRSCFPGDHGTAVICLTAFAWRYAGRAFGLGATVLSVIFVLPRLVVGAHWATDLLVGSVAFAIPVLCLVLATPVHGKVIDAVCALGDRILALTLSRYSKGAGAV